MVNSECCLWATDEGFPAVLMSAVTDCKLAKLGWNKIETPEHFFPKFLSFLPYFWYPLHIENAICILAFEGQHETYFLYRFIKKWFHILVYNFNCYLTVTRIATKREPMNDWNGLFRWCWYVGLSLIVRIIGNTGANIKLHCRSFWKDSYLSFNT